MIPTLVKRIAREQAEHGKSYEEARWAHLSPAFRAAHNRLRVTRGLAPLPPPKIDMYVPPRAPERIIDPNAPELRAAAAQFMGKPLMGGGGEGFRIKPGPGSKIAHEMDFRLVEEQRTPIQRHDSGFSINGRSEPSPDQWRESINRERREQHRVDQARLADARENARRDVEERREERRERYRVAEEKQRDQHRLNQEAELARIRHALRAMEDADASWTGMQNIDELEDEGDPYLMTEELRMRRAKDAASHNSDDA